MRINLSANTPFLVLPYTSGYSVDFIVQNNGSTTVYFLDDKGQTLTDGIWINAGQSISKDHWKKDIILGSSVANQSVSMAYQINIEAPTGTKEKPFKLPVPLLVKVVNKP